ncbi:UNVERIFIED_CONTAM: hypothetical protein GTU68_001071 [Idotea baltica]|nr:hypothetical protein [Idotea baltica]
MKRRLRGYSGRVLEAISWEVLVSGDSIL